MRVLKEKLPINRVLPCAASAVPGGDPGRWPRRRQRRQTAPRSQRHAARSSGAGHARAAWPEATNVREARGERGETRRQTGAVPDSDSSTAHSSSAQARTSSSRSSSLAAQLPCAVAAAEVGAAAAAAAWRAWRRKRRTALQHVLKERKAGVRRCWFVCLKSKSSATDSSACTRRRSSSSGSGAGSWLIKIRSTRRTRRCARSFRVALRRRRANSQLRALRPLSPGLRLLRPYCHLAGTQAMVSFTSMGGKGSAV